jgi:hypothetical protein
MVTALSLNGMSRILFLHLYHNYRQWQISGNAKETGNNK